MSESKSLRVLWTLTTIFLLQVGHSMEQGTRQFLPSYGAASPLIDHRSQYQHQQQQVILPGGFQNQYPIQANFQTLRNGNSRSSIQNGHFQLRNPSTAIINPLLTSRPQFSPLLTGLSRERDQSVGGGISSAATSSGQDQRPAESQYEYYDDTDSDIVYHYSNEDGGGTRGGGSVRQPSRPQIAVNGIKKYQQNRPSQISSSSFIPLVDDDEPLGQGLAFKGRSVHPQPSQRNSAVAYGGTAPSNPTPLPSLLRNNSVGTKYKSVPPPPETPAVEPAASTKRPAVLRGPVNRFILTSRPPQIKTTVPPTATPSRSHSSSSSSRFSPRHKQHPQQVANKEDDSSSSSSREKEPTQLQTQQQISIASASAPTEEEYEEYHDEDNGDYYEGEEDPHGHSPAQYPSKEKLDKEPETSKTSSLTVSVSTKTSSTTTTPSPLVPLKPKATVGPGIVISVATTRSVSDSGQQQQVTTSPPTTTPKVTFSRATGSSIVVASVQTSRSVATPSQRLSISSQHPPQGSSKQQTDPEYYEEEYTYPDNYPVLNGAPLSDLPNPPKPSTPSLHSPTESIMDKLDRVQSELANGVLSGLHNPSVSSTTTFSPLSTTTTTTTTARAKSSDSIQVPVNPVPSSHEEHQKSFNLISTGNVFPSSSLSSSSSAADGGGGSKGINVQNILKGIKFNDDVSAFLPPEYKSTLTSKPAAVTTTSTTTTSTIKPEFSSSTLNSLIGNIKFEEASISALLPKGYKLPSSFPSKVVPITTTNVPSSTTTEPTTTTLSSTTEKSKNNKNNPFESLLAKVTFTDSIAALLPPGYDESLALASSTTKTTTTTTTTQRPKTGIEALIPNIKFDDLSKFLPPGYKPPTSDSETDASSTTEKPSTSTASATVVTSKPLNKLVFPTRPGGFKASRPVFTTEPPRADTPPPPKVTIQKGGPTRATTEFTGWPTQSTTPTPSTTTTTTESTTTTTTTTKRTTTTTLPPKRSPVSTCRDSSICKMEAVLRIVGFRWKPEYSDINTEEWKHLERTIKRELDAAYRSSGLAQYYRTVEIEGFTRGSVIVDYFVLLENVTTKLTSADVRALFHASLPPSDHQEQHEDHRESDNVLLAADERLRLGRYTIDPKYTDFKVRNITTEIPGASTSEGIIPQWGIAVIVIGLASLMFVIIFGVTVLVNRHRNSKKKNAVSLTQEMLSEFNKSHLGADNYGAPDDLYNMDDVWNDNKQTHHMDRTFDRKIGKRASSSGKGSANYNIYDSWKTEWNGYYYNMKGGETAGNYYGGDSGYGHGHAPNTRRRSDYDTNF